MKTPALILNIISFAIVSVWAGSVLAGERLSFTPAKGNDLGKLIVRIVGDKTANHPVTDIHLDIKRYQGKTRDALMAPNTTGGDPYKGEFYAYLYVVAGGKLYRDGEGHCRRWENDVTTCSIVGDGGHFQLHRDLGKKFNTLTVILRSRLFEGDLSAAIQIGEVNWRNGDERDQVYLDVKSDREARFSFSQWANPGG